MGSYDTVSVKCLCGKEIEFQTKSGDCTFQAYTLKEAPPIVAASLDGVSERCQRCGRTIVIDVQVVTNTQFGQPSRTWRLLYY